VKLIKMKSDICGVGGGPAGLAAAIALTRSGREATVLDCALPPIDKACGEGLMPDSLEALAKLGVQLSNVGAMFQGIRFFGPKAAVSGDFPNGVGRGLRRVQLHEILIARAESLGIRMLWGVKNLHTERGQVRFNGGYISTSLIVGADGQKSTVREQAGLHQVVREKRRFGFRKHYDIAPWSPYVEIYWGHGSQIYITPVALNQICVALISKDPHLRLDAALATQPALAEKLGNAAVVTPERGSLSTSRRYRRVTADGYALLGDASASVDAITGEGMCLAFRQAAALVEALDSGDLRQYERSHRKIMATPLRMAALMLLLDTNSTVQRKALAGLEANPSIFSSILAAHVGHKPLSNILSRQLFSFGLEVLRA
jgi:2-polyprenyl-6-methoxyphenol hydroxylase-like FAD-dependent oxidoreductase